MDLVAYHKFWPFAERIHSAQCHNGSACDCWTAPAKEAITLSLIGNLTATMSKKDALCSLRDFIQPTYQHCVCGAVDLLPRMIPTLNPAVPEIRNPAVEWLRLEGYGFTLRDPQNETRGSRAAGLLATILNVTAEDIEAVVHE